MSIITFFPLQNRCYYIQLHSNEVDIKTRQFYLSLFFIIVKSQGYPAFYHFLKENFITAERGCVACGIWKCWHNFHCIKEKHFLYWNRGLCIDYICIHFYPFSVESFEIIFKENTLQHTKSLQCSQVLVSEWRNVKIFFNISIPNISLGLQEKDNCRRQSYLKRDWSER